MVSLKCLHCHSLLEEQPKTMKRQIRWRLQWRLCRFAVVSVRFGPLVGGSWWGRKGVFCPNLYSPLCTSYSMTRHIKNDYGHIKNDFMITDILKMTWVDKYTSSYTNENMYTSSMPDTTTNTRCMPGNPEPMKLWYMPGICKGPSSLTWLYRLPKTWHVLGICLGTKINKFLCTCQFLVYIWHISP